MGFDTHRPLTLRLLHEAAESGEVDWTETTLTRVLEGIGTWITRFWLSDRPMAGMNKAFAELAHRLGPNSDEDPAEFWLSGYEGYGTSAWRFPTTKRFGRGSEVERRMAAAQRAPRRRSCVP